VTTGSMSHHIDVLVLAAFAEKYPIGHSISRCWQYSVSMRSLCQRSPCGVSANS
jgi:hypothetical protein